jgi:two-component system response regulator PilR (NtrC family)
MPPLRGRAEDVQLIAEHFLAKYTREMNKTIDGFSADAVAALSAYHWPGNVRELENVVERAVALESERHVAVATLPENVRSGHSLPVQANSTGDPIAEGGFNLERHLQDIERSHLERALERSGGVQTRAADVLGLSFRQFRYLAKKYGLK